MLLLLYPCMMPSRQVWTRGRATESHLRQKYKERMHWGHGLMEVLGSKLVANWLTKSVAKNKTCGEMASLRAPFSGSLPGHPEPQKAACGSVSGNGVVTRNRQLCSPRCSALRHLSVVAMFRFLVICHDTRPATLQASISSLCKLHYSATDSRVAIIENSL